MAKEGFVLVISLLRDHAHCLSRASRAAYPRESQAQEASCRKNVISKYAQDCMYVIFSSLNKISCSDLVSQASMVLKNHHICFYQVLPSNVCLYKMILKYLDVFIVPPECRRSNQCHQHIGILVWLSLPSMFLKIPISLCIQIVGDSGHSCFTPIHSSNHTSHSCHTHTPIFVSYSYVKRLRV